MQPHGHPPWLSVLRRSFQGEETTAADDGGVDRREAGPEVYAPVRFNNARKQFICCRWMGHLSFLGHTLADAPGEWRPGRARSALKFWRRRLGPGRRPGASCGRLWPTPPVIVR